MTGRFIGALLSPKPTTSISLPAHLLSFGSKVSMWLTPPHMNKKMTDFALAFRGGSFSASLIAPSAKTPPSDNPKNPPPIWCKNRRRAMRPHGYNSALPDINEFIEIEQQPRKLLEPRHIIFDVRARVIFFRRRRKAPERHAISQVDRRIQIAVRLLLQ